MKKRHLQETELDKQIRIKEEANAKALLELRKNDLTHRTRYNEEGIALRNVSILSNLDEPAMDCLVELQTTSDGFNDLVYEAGKDANAYRNNETLKNAREMNNTIRELAFALRKEKKEHKQSDLDQMEYYRERCIAHDEIGEQDREIANLKIELYDATKEVATLQEKVNKTNARFAQRNETYLSHVAHLQDKNQDLQKKNEALLAKIQKSAPVLKATSGNVTGIRT